MAAMMAPRMDDIDALAPETVVCRCEDVRAGELNGAIAAGAVTIDQLKAWTRAGMGPCQGRICSETVATVLAKHVGDRERVGMWTGRAPLRPVSVDALIGDAAYEDIPIPKAAPL
jgi:NAD(P)H-nitrite reductase large subunit